MIAKTSSVGLVNAGMSSWAHQFTITVPGLRFTLCEMDIGTSGSQRAALKKLRTASPQTQASSLLKLISE